jgi:hypothetical protein
MEITRAAFDLDYSDYSRVRRVAAFSAHVSVGTPDTQHHSRNRICRLQDRRLMTVELDNITEGTLKAKWLNCKAAWGVRCLF